MYKYYFYLYFSPQCCEKITEVLQSFFCQGGRTITGTAPSNSPKGEDFDGNGNNTHINKLPHSPTGGAGGG